MKPIFYLALGLFSFNTAVAATQEIDISGMKFAPAVIDINQGDTVRWINRDVMPHVVQGSFTTSENITPDERFEFTFNQAGNFDYICQLHPSMTGTIRVAAVTQTTTEDEGAVSFSDLFETQDTFASEDLSATQTTPVASDTNNDIFTSAASITPPPTANTATVQPPVPSRNITNAASSTTSLPTSGGSHYGVLFAVLAIMGLGVLATGFKR